MNVSIIMPCREADPWRTAIHSWVQERIAILYPKFELCRGDNEGQFSRSAARNIAAKKATGDIFIVWDGDTFCNDVHLQEALKIAADSGLWAFPYGRYYNLDRPYTWKVLNYGAGDHFERPLSDEIEHDLYSTGGIYVITRDAWNDVGGYDENFVDWGYEDTAFGIAAQTILGAPSRVSEGWVSHLWHPAPESVRFDQPNIDYNRARARRYERAREGRDAKNVTRALIREGRS